MKALSFLFPAIGWVLWAIKRNTSYTEARDCSNWAWRGVSVGAAVCVVFFGLNVYIGIALLMLSKLFGETELDWTAYVILSVILWSVTKLLYA